MQHLPMKSPISGDARYLPIATKSPTDAYTRCRLTACVLIYAVHLYGLSRTNHQPYQVSAQYT